MAVFYKAWFEQAKRVMDDVSTTFEDRQTQKTQQLWIRAYRWAAVAALILSVFFILNVAADSRRTVCVDEPERINPNTASVASLVRLPGIGKARALDILHFRQINASGGPTFKNANDLEQIKGIGPKTAEKLAPWLTFEEE